MNDITEMSYKERIKNLESLLYTETHKLNCENVELMDLLEEKQKEIMHLRRRIHELEYLLKCGSLYE